MTAEIIPLGHLEHLERKLAAAKGAELTLDGDLALRLIATAKLAHAAEQKGFERGMFCAVVVILEQRGLVDPDVKELFGAAGDPQNADEKDQEIFRQYGLLPAKAPTQESKRGADLTRAQIDILDHAVHRAAGGLYCGGGPNMDVLVNSGLMECAGRKSFVPDPYYRITNEGREALRQAEAATYPPHKPDNLELHES